jgi:hypothetical protein
MLKDRYVGAHRGIEMTATRNNVSSLGGGRPVPQTEGYPVRRAGGSPNEAHSPITLAILVLVPPESARVARSIQTNRVIELLSRLMQRSLSHHPCHYIPGIKNPGSSQCVYLEQ